MTTRNPIVNWTYSRQYTGLHNLVDPRIAVARHIEWYRPSTNTTNYTIPEPENYNRAVFSSKPIEFTWAKYQVIYKDQSRNGWITACWLTAEECAKFDLWAADNDMTYWRHLRWGQPRKPKPMLERGSTKAEISLDERLLTMGYYKNFVVKYFNDSPHIVKNRLGEARANLADLLNDE
jgi:hypothetical protein